MPSGGKPWQDPQLRSPMSALQSTIVLDPPWRGAPWQYVPEQV
jgi:hypothetical protein